MAASGAAKSFMQSLKRFFKKPWEITGPCSDPEYREAIPMALEYRRFCPATVPAKAIIPSSDPETVFDIKYYTRDRRRDRPPVRRTVLRKADVEKMMAEKTWLSEIGHGAPWSEFNSKINVQEPLDCFKEAQ
ncbi:hypothetical protein J5N97_008426 [Dioscorea zingiberensis]|uniref:Uncharacterized protein n=1 Tax=Dioscorea zingiberensis TaxID=325984 RepID=A0A9D5CV45_9LILI|nr:hypothetical protein J5N97_008426 [Dioscorea zingiberensis]